MKKKLLWLSLCAPYDSVGHGGGKTHNYYLKEVSRSGKFDIELFTFCDLDEYEKADADLTAYGIHHEIVPWNHDFNISNVKRKVQLLDSMYNPINKYGGATNEYYWSHIKKYIRQSNICPDIVIMQWTEIGLFLPRLKTLLPNAKFVAIEEDVKFLALQRHIISSKGRIKQTIARLKYKNLEKCEIIAMCKANTVITYTNKDKQLLNERGLNNVTVIAPYFDNYIDLIRNRETNRDILFYGAMSRQDNYESAIWFIENVFPYIEDKTIRFICVGSKPVQKLMAYASERIIITGFIERVDLYLQNSLCLVAPLVSGAGIKIKILEALSAGVPVLTNDIGIEGIDAENGKDYLLCHSPQDYIDVINKMTDDMSSFALIGESAKKRIKNNYDLESDSRKFINLLAAL